MSVSRQLALLLLLSAAALCGCTSEGPTIAKVSGRVTFGGKPLPNAQVIFAPEDGSLVASGTTDAEGRYELTTLEEDDGAIVGTHQVAIVARGPGKPLPESEVGTGLPGGALAPGDPLIPEKYFSTATSGLTRDVVDGTNTFDFDL